MSWLYKEITETKHDYYGNEITKTVEVLDKKKLAFVIASGVIGIVLIIMLLLSICRVPTGHTGVITTFGRVEKSYSYDEGVHFKAPWKRVVKMDNRVQKDTLELTCFSSDIQEVKLKYTVNHQIDKKNAATIYQTIGKKYFDTVITPNISEVVKVVTAQYTAENLVGDRSKLAAEIESVLAEKLREFNIEVVSTSIEDMDFTDAYTNAVEAKQVAQQNKLKAETVAEQKVIEAKANAEVAKIKAQGAADAKKIAAEAEAEANKKLSNSLDEKVLKNKWYEKWNGKYPQVVSGGGTIIEFPMD